MAAISPAHCIPHQLVLFDKSRAKIDIAAIASALERPKRTIRHRAQHLWVWDGDGPMLRIGLAVGAGVQRESALIAKVLGEGRKDQDAIAACDGRIEIGWKSFEDVRSIIVDVNVELEELVKGTTVYLMIDQLGLTRPKGKRPRIAKKLRPLSYVEEMESELRRLAEFARSLKDPELVPGDLSWESLDRLERLYSYATDKENEVTLPPELKDLAARHIGEVLRARVGGEWTATHDEYIGLFKVPELPRTHVVSTYHLVGADIRRKTERFDLAKQRAAFTKMLETRDEELRAFGKELDEKLDFKVENLDRIERAFLRVAGSAPNEALIQRATLYVGEILVRRCKTAWELEEKPKFIGFGEPLVDGWNPRKAVDDALLEQTGSTMRERLTLMLT